ncbi:MAG: cation-translocating P-type ATPase [Anaerolineae bacterium]|nr:cation-translocating P-type ATPase [Anaerolineae bacterium]NUQ03573.1 cation-translocating P-type ATPase [Anaerolineae bacterium]
MQALQTYDKSESVHPWHTSDAQDVLQDLTSHLEVGLSSVEAQARVVRYGANELVEAKLTSPLAILWEQITGPLVLLLIFAAVISAFLGKADSVIAISAIVILNAVLGVVQEYRAEKAMAALKRMAAALVRVRRDGAVADIDPRSLVPGDIVLLEAGSVVPADARLVETANLRVQEASLTGESEPVEKNTAVLTDTDAPLGDRYNMVYMGTSVTYGRGVAVVVETGMKTQLGRIAQLIQNVEGEKTPLQRRMDELGGVLIRAALGVMVIAIIVGVIVGDSLQDVLLNGVAIAVAVVPEGLPAVVTIALALGAQRMLKRHALIRKLPAVETLGSVTTICSDKTGTLTQNKMTVTIVDVAGQESRIDDVLKIGYNALVQANTSGKSSTDAAVAITLAGDTLCNDAILERGEHEHEFKTVGDPTETALVDAAARYGLQKPRLETFLPRTGEVPFDSDRKRMTTVHRVAAQVEPTNAERYLIALLDLHPGTAISFTKGAVDGLLGISTSVWHEGQIVPMTETWRQRIEQANNRLASNGLRVLGLAFRRFEHPQFEVTQAHIEQELVFVGMVGIIDPPRLEVKDAVRVAKEAGIRPVMITGDHPLTAFAIARELGIAKEGDRILTGTDLSQMDVAQLESTVENVAVYARVSPEHKLNIVQALQRRGHITAMTGDGVNDAPALKRSDIGVAMGITGTAVSKEASDMVILDDNFATIVSAVEEGRTIYDNVRRFIKYLLASNTGELIVLLVTQLIAGMTIPLTTLQILWMNLITDGVPALALGVEKSEKGGMKRPPYAPNESLFGRGLGRHILIVGAVLGITGLALGYWAFSSGVMAANGAPAWNTMVFIFLTLAQMGHALALRSHSESLFKVGLRGNRLLIGAVIVTVALQMVAIYTPFFNTLFNTAPLTLDQLALCLVLSTVVFWAVEAEKLLVRRGILK